MAAVIIVPALSIIACAVITAAVVAWRLAFGPAFVVVPA